MFAVSSFRKSLGASAEGGYDVGPMRVFPGGLAITRAIGNPYAKLSELGGRPGVITAVPDIKSYKISDNDDFMIIACIWDCINV